MIRDLIIENRTCRRFYQDVPVERKTLEGLIDLARCSASASNIQPLKYILCNEPEKNATVFQQLGFAGRLKDWPGPAEGERPAAYIIMLLDTEISKNPWCDHGIAAQSILLGAREAGLAGCMHGSFKKEPLTKLFDISPRYEIQLVISLGKPKETVVLEDTAPGGDIAYYRDSNDVHHVPKRPLSEIIIG
ncbi:MAG: nitroreductase family protein [Dehalococcoidales bacterium]|nr:nitroreductase family protein [Dehalococcoidales bacterium]